MNITIGTDLVEIERIKKAMEHPSFLTRVFGESELTELKGRGLPPQSVAGAFAAKEAFSKALGTGIRGFSLREVEVLHLPGGKPYFCLSGAALQLAQGRVFELSISHADHYATATAIAFEQG